MKHLQKGFRDAKIFPIAELGGWKTESIPLHSANQPRRPDTTETLKIIGHYTGVMEISLCNCHWGLGWSFWKCGDSRSPASRKQSAVWYQRRRQILQGLTWLAQRLEQLIFTQDCLGIGSIKSRSTSNRYENECVILKQIWRLLLDDILNICWSLADH